MKHLINILTITAIYLFIGCSDSTSGDEVNKNHRPTFALIQPDQDSIVYAGSIVDFQAVIVDQDGDIDRLKILVNDELLIDAVNPGYTQDTLWLNYVTWYAGQGQVGDNIVKMELFDQAGNKTDSTFTLKVKDLYQWNKTYSRGKGWRAAQTTDSGFVIIANTAIFKLDKYGNKLWERAHGNSPEDYFYGYYITALQDNSCVIATAVGTNIPYIKDSKVIKLSPNGAIEWQKQITGESPRQICSDAQNNLYLATTGKLYKYTPEGQLCWDKTLEGKPEGLYLTKEGDLLLGGYIYPTGDDSTTVVLNKMDRDGNLKWSKESRIRASYYSNPISIDQSTDGDYLVGIGVFGVIRISTEGTLKYRKNIDSFSKLIAAPNNGFFILSYKGIDLFDSNADFKYKVLAVNYVNDLIPTFDNGYFMCGLHEKWIWAGKSNLALPKQSLIPRRTYLQSKKFYHKI